jgi:hypothetical protein
VGIGEAANDNRIVYKTYVVFLSWCCIPKHVIPIRIALIEIADNMEAPEPQLMVIRLN